MIMEITIIAFYFPCIIYDAATNGDANLVYTIYL